MPTTEGEIHTVASRVDFPLMVLLFIFPHIVGYLNSKKKKSLLICNLDFDAKAKNVIFALNKVVIFG